MLATALARVGVLLLAQAQAAPPDGAAVFDEACRIVHDQFYDPGLHGVDWDALHDRLSPDAAAATTPAALSAVINEALDSLHASHTHHYHRGQTAYYELRDVFDPDGGVSYVGIGLATREIGGKIFIEDVYPGGPAAEAGLLPGDEIVAVEGQPWADVDSFRGRAGEPTRIEVRRDGPESGTLELSVTPRRIQPHELFLSSIGDSVQKIGSGGVVVGYVRVRSYAGQEFQDALMDVVTGKFVDVSALVLDIRGGWGGARPAYMALANPVTPTMEFRRRGGEWEPLEDAWHRPIVLLVDGGSRSGKEVLAFAYKQHGLARLVGERTAGAVLAGRLWMLGDRSALYVAIADVLVDGERLEGVGVAPDIEIPRDLPYSAGRDPQLDGAVREAARLAAEK